MHRFQGTITIAAGAALLVGGMTVTLSPPGLAVAVAAVGSPAAAALPEVQMICGAQQTDINNGSQVAISAALSVDMPTAKRVIGYRPYLAVRDLSVVEGIGPERLASIIASRRACATPTQLPPPSTEACTGQRVDVQSATANELIKRLGVNRNTATRLIDARPFAQLRHLVPERVPGIGKGTLDAIIAASCLTPSPVRTALTSFRWAYRDVATTVARDGFALMVSPGTLGVFGAWLSITPLADDPGPTADFDIHGTWTGEVAVTLPRDLNTPDGWTAPVVFHNPGDWDRLFAGSTVSSTANAVTFTTDALSPYGTTSYDPALFPLADNIETQTPDEFIKASMDLQYDQFVEPVEFEFEGCEDTSVLITNAFVPSGQINCSRELVGGKGYWTLTNDTGDTLGGLVGEGAVATLNFDGSVEFVQGSDGTNRFMADAVRDINVAAEAAGGDGYALTPGASVTVSLASGASGTVTFDDALRSSLYNFGLAQLDQVLEVAKLAGAPVTARQTCITGISYGALSADEVPYGAAVGCSLDLAEDGLAALPQTTGVTKALKGVKVAAKLLLVLDALETTFEAAGFEGAFVALQHRHIPPTGGGFGSVGTGPLNGPDGTLPSNPADVTNAIGRFSGDPGAAYLVTDEQPNVAFGIVVGGDYICFAQQYPVRDDLQISELFWLQEDATPAACSPGPDRQVPLNATNWILRQGDSHAFLLDETGQIRPINSGGCYLYLADRYYVLDWTAPSQIAKFPVSIEPACP